MKQRSAFGQHTLPREYFVSEEIYRLEHERVFGRSWLLAGHVSQLDGPGAYFVHTLGRESVLVVRDGDGAVRAFHNHCRHRGTRLCSEPAGTLGAAIQCPYHAWTYGLDGALRAAPNMTGVAGFDRADYPLHPVALADWQGFLFLNLAPDPQPFAEALPALVGKFEPWRLPELQVGAPDGLRGRGELEALLPQLQRVLPLPQRPPAPQQADAVPPDRERPRRRAGPGRPDVDDATPRAA